MRQPGTASHCAVWVFVRDVSEAGEVSEVTSVVAGERQARGYQAPAPACPSVSLKPLRQRHRCGADVATATSMWR